MTYNLDTDYILPEDLKKNYEDFSKNYISFLHLHICSEPSIKSCSKF